MESKKNHHMKTSTLPSAIIARFKSRKNEVPRAAKADSPRLFSLFLIRYKRDLSLLALLLFMMLEFNQQGFSQSQTFNYTGSSQTFIAPIGVTSITIECWGGGGAGGGGSFVNMGGGGGGAYKKTTAIAVVSGNSYTIVVGAGGTGGTGNGPAGSASTALGVTANGGSGVTGSSGGAGGTGGTYNGGSGASGTFGGHGGGGGGSAGTSSNGNTANSATGAAAVTGGGAGGNGGASIGSNGSAGSVPGGGGGGGISTGTCSGGSGGNGKVVITWICPSATISYAGTPFCSSNSNPQGVALSGSTGGTFSASPAGLTINTSTGAITPSSSTPGTYTVHYQIAADRGCPAVDATATITINSLSSATISYTGTPFCTSAAPVSVSRTGTAGGTYSALPTGLTIDAATGTITPGTSNAGSYTIHYQIAASGSCPAVDATTPVTINASPTATVASKTNIACKSGTDGVITIHASGGTGAYSYSVDNGATWMPSATDPYSYGGLIAIHLYRIMVKDANGCQSVSIP